MDSYRLFLGIELPDSVRTAAAEHIAALRDEFPQVRVGWERPEKLHLTVKFLGKVESTRVGAIQDAAAKAAAGVKIILAEIHRAGFFGQLRAPRVLWLGVGKGSEEIIDLAASVEDLVSPLGFPRETRGFSPHLTVGRIKEPHRSSELAVRHVEMGFASQPFEIAALTLFASELTPAGSKYSVVSRHSLSLFT